MIGKLLSGHAPCIYTGIFCMSWVPARQLWSNNPWHSRAGGCEIFNTWFFPLLHLLTSYKAALNKISDSYSVVPFWFYVKAIRAFSALIWNWHSMPLRTLQSSSSFEEERNRLRTLDDGSYNFPGTGGLLGKNGVLLLMLLCSFYLFVGVRYCFCLMCIVDLLWMGLI